MRERERERERELNGCRLTLQHTHIYKHLLFLFVLFFPLLSFYSDLVARIGRHPRDPRSEFVAVVSNQPIKLVPRARAGKRQKKKKDREYSKKKKKKKKSMKKKKKPKKSKNLGE